MRIVLLIVVIVGVVGLLGMSVFAMAIALEARKVPNLPLHMRVNPFNVLSDRSLWTPEIHSLHRTALRCGLVFVGSTILALLALLFDVLIEAP